MGGTSGEQSLEKRYERYYKNRLESALLYQDFVVDTLYQWGLVVNQYASKAYQQKRGESRAGIEIKYDEKSLTTTNLYIEIAEKAAPRPGDFVPSGIYRNDNTWLYVIGNYDEIYLLGKSLLKALDASGRYQHLTIPLGTSQGFLLPKSVAEKWANAVLFPKAHYAMSRLTTNLCLEGKELETILRASGIGQLSLWLQEEDAS